MTDFVTVEGKELFRAMRIATAIIEKRNTIPVLSCVMISVSEAHGLRINATDMDINLAIDVDNIEDDGDWSMCIQAHTLAQIAAMAGAQPVRIERSTRTVEARVRHNGTIIPAYQQEQARIIVGDDAAIYEIDALPSSDFPSMSRARGDSIERFTNGMFAETIKKVAWAVSTEETRYYLNGVAWQAQERGARFVATDGHRLASCRYVSGDDGRRFSRIIPRKTVAFIDKFLRARDVEVFATDNENVIEIETAGMRMLTKLIDGTFPDVDRVIPKELNHEFDIKADEFLIAVKQATAVGGEKSRAVRFHDVDGKLNIERKSPDFGSAKIKTSTDWPKGATSFGMNGRYVSEVFGSCIGTIKLAMADAGSPFLVTDEDSTMTRVMMPMRV